MEKEDQPKNLEIQKLRALQDDAQRDIERLEEERAGNRGSTGKKSGRADENRSSKTMPVGGQQDGSFVHRQEVPKTETSKKLVAGQEIKQQQNKSAELIRELGNVSFPIKTLCVYLSRCFKVGDNETSDVMVEKFRLTEKFNELREISDELIKIITSREAKPSVEDLETNKAQITVEIMNLLWEIDILDLSLLKSLPEKDTVDWRKIETAKNQLRKFVGDNESITTISPILRSDTLTPKANPVETVATDKTTETEPIVTSPVKSPDEIAAEKLAKEKERNKKMFALANSGEEITPEMLKSAAFSDEEAQDFLDVLKLTK